MILKTDITGVSADDSVAFQAHVESRPMLPSGKVTQLGLVQEAYLAARAAASVTVQASLIRDFGETVAVSTATLTAEGSESHVFRAFENLVNADLTHAALKLGDASAVANYWSLDILHVNVLNEGER